MKKIWKGLAAIGMENARMAAGRASTWGIYQPKEPKMDVEKKEDKRK